MWVSAFGHEFHFDEKAWEQRMTEANERLDREHPWPVERLVEIQKRMRSAEDRLLEHMRMTATPDPVEELRRHLREMQT